MKKTYLCLIMALAALSVTFSCTKNPAAPPAATPTLNISTQTAVALQTAGLTAQQTATMQAQQTAVAGAVQATETCQAIQTHVVETQTAVVWSPFSDLVLVPGGTFTQVDQTQSSGKGNPDSFIHTVSAFKMGQYQVTYERWHKVYLWAIANGFTFADAGTEGMNGTAGAAPTAAKYQPVTMINWRDAIVWCNAYSLMSGLSPVYCDPDFAPLTDSSDGLYGSSLNTAAGSYDNPYMNWGANGYRLPTEGEYQYAASYVDGTNWLAPDFASGATSGYNNLSGQAATELVAWFSLNSGGSTQEVGLLISNALGIYDMNGNVWEWCWDFMGQYPYNTSIINYRGPLTGTSRITHGGAYNCPVNLTCAGMRQSGAPYSKTTSRGFRVARSN